MVNTYTIISGDTLDSIATLTGDTVTALQLANPTLNQYGETDDLSDLQGLVITIPSQSQSAVPLVLAPTHTLPTNTVISDGSESTPISISSIDPDAVLPNSIFTLNQLTATSQGTDNSVTDPGILSNLNNLAIMLTALSQNIGPFSLISGYRTEATNESIIAAGNPGSTTSLHEQGIAEDIYPTTMSLADYFSQIITSPLAESLGEIYIKPSQNTIHVSLSTGAGNNLVLASGTTAKTAHAGIYDPKLKIYRVLTPDESTYYASLNPYNGASTITIPQAAEFSEALETEASDDLSQSVFMGQVVALALVAGMILLAWPKDKEHKSREV